MDKVNELIQIVCEKHCCIIDIAEDGAMFTYVWFRDQPNPLDLQIDYEIKVSCDTSETRGGDKEKVLGPRVKPGAQREEIADEWFGDCLDRKGFSRTEIDAECSTLNL